MISTLVPIKIPLLKGLMKRLEVDRAVLFGVLANLWSLASGPVSIILIATKFTPEIQGYYYTFGNLLSFQKFVELGMGTVILQFASHEWAKLGLNKEGYIVGDIESLSRLRGIARIALKWYGAGSIVVIIILSIGGYIFFSGSNKNNINWFSPWIFLSLLTGINMLFVPLWSLLEGCNQVSQLYTFRFVQGILLTSSVWISILSGANLWTVSIGSLTSILAGVFFLCNKYKNYVKTLFFITNKRKMGISWRKEMLPMQWRLTVSWISGYLVFSLFTPVLFKYHGPVVAGQFGMTWTLISVVNISSSWLSPRIPQFGILIAQRRFDELDRLFWRLTRIVVLMASIIATALWLFIFILNSIDYQLLARYASRILPPLPSGLLLTGQVLVVASLPFSSYLRAHKQEPVMGLSVLSAIMVGLSTIILGKYYSATGMAAGYLITHIIILPLVFLLWQRKRFEWHRMNTI